MPTGSVRLTALSCVLFLFVASCGGGDSTGPDPNAVAQVAVSASGSTTIPLNGTLQLQASLLNSQGQPVQGESVSWSSQDTNVAQVSQSGLVTGVGVGSTQIVASAGGRTGQVTVTVHDPNPPDAPSNLQASVVSNTEIELTWSDNSTNEDEFRIERETVDAAAGPDAGIAFFTEIATVGAGITSYTDSGLAPAQAYRYRVQACNQNGCSSYSSEVERATFATLVIDTDALPNGTVGVQYSRTLAATGGEGEPVWSLASGTLPPGVGLSTGGVVSGTPTEAGTFEFTVRAEGGGQSVEKALQIEVSEEILAPEVTTSSLPDGVIGESYSAQLEASQGDGTYAWAITAGALPDGLSLTSAGVIEGTPTAVGTFTFTVEVTSADLTGDRELSITIAAAPVVITTTSLPDGTVGVAYNQEVEATGGDGVSYAWSIQSGALPPGLSLGSSSGVISGTPGEAGSFSFTVQVVSGGETDDQALTIDIGVGPVVVTTTSLPDGTVGTAYSETLTASGGDGVSYAWSVISGALPPGLSLDGGGGVISGTPSETGTSNFTVQVESGGETDDQALSITIAAAAPVAFENWYLPVGINGTSYSYGIEVSGGDGATYSFSVVAGGLPPGLSLGAADGVISGTPSQSGSFFFEVEVESGGSTATRHYALTISTVGSGGFNIALLNASGEIPSSAFRIALDDALAKWEAVVTSNHRNSFTWFDDLDDSFCQGHGSKLKKGEVIEDLVILLDVRSIDGVGGTLARAGPCGYYVGSPGLFFAGSFVVDSDDLGGLASDQLLALTIHEIGHVVGIGTLWDFDGRELLVGAEGADPRFVGVEGVAAYKDLGGADDDIAVENTGGEGTRDRHWRNAVFENEVMTGFISASGVSMPLSIMSVESVEDLGYSVNPAAADAYSLPAGAAAVSAAGAIALPDDVVIEPYVRILPDGSIEIVYPPR